MVFNRDIFLVSSDVISSLITIIEVVSIYLVIIRKDNLGIHDMICRTMVICSKNKK